MLAVLLLLFLTLHVDIKIIVWGQMVDGILGKNTLLETQVCGC